MTQAWRLLHHRLFIVVWVDESKIQEVADFLRIDRSEISDSTLQTILRVGIWIGTTIITRPVWIPCRPDLCACRALSLHREGIFGTTGAACAYGSCPAQAGLALICLATRTKLDYRKAGNGYPRWPRAG